MLVTPRQVAKPSQQELSEAVHKSIEASVHGSSSLSDATLQGSPSHVPMPYTTIPIPSQILVMPDQRACVDMMGGDDTQPMNTPFLGFMHQMERSAS